METSSLEATVGGKEASIVRLQGPDDDLLILLVLDLVGDINEIDLARQGLVSSIAEARSNTYIGVLRAQDGLKVLLDPTNDHEAVIDAINTFPVSGTPGLLDTVETAAEIADSILTKAFVRIAILYVTDSNIYDYRENFTNPVINWSDRGDLSRRFGDGIIRDRISKLDAKMSARQAPVFVVHLEYENDQANEAYQNGIMQISSTTGGKTTFCRSNTEILPAVTDMMGTIFSHYGLDLQVPPVSGDTVEITLTSSDGNLSYRNRYDLKE